MVVDGDSRIFVDAKGVEMTYLGQLSNNPRDIQQATESSLVKGIKQGCSVARNIQGVDRIDGISVPAGDENYLIVITYKELYIGNGRVLRDLVSPSVMAHLEKCDGFGLIPTEHMYFMSVDEFEVFAQAVHEGKVGFVDCLRKAVEADSVFSTRKLTFSQHLGEEGWPDEIPGFLDDEFVEVLTRLDRLHRG